MIRRVLWALLAALATACASATGFNEIPLSGRIALVVAACVFAGALQMGDILKNFGFLYQCELADFFSNAVTSRLPPVEAS